MSRQAASLNVHKSKTLDNKYMLGDEIGKGAYGRVYKGLDLENGDFVAIKQVSLEKIAQEDLNVIMQEIDLLKNLNHKNIVKYLGSLKTKSHLHIILEYVENGSLADIIKPNKFGPFPESLVAVYISQVLEGLVYLHEQGVIHRDIKGANILTTKEGLVKLADFGVATKLTEADVNTHSVVGTPYWMAPEVIEMSGVCAASDIWSVGCTVIELLTCVPPYYDLQTMPALYRIVQDEQPPIPDGLSPDITDFLHQCFKKDARQRPDAKTLLSHPWIQNCRRALQSSLRNSGANRNVTEDTSLDAGNSNGDEQPISKSPSLSEGISSHKETELNIRHDDHGSSSNVDEETGNSANDQYADQVPTFAIHESLSTKPDSGTSIPNFIKVQEPSSKNNHVDLIINGDAGSEGSGRKPISATKHEDKGVLDGNEPFGFRAGSDHSLAKAANGHLILGGNELSRFSDTPGDASLDDLFQPMEKIGEDQSAEASTSNSTTDVVQGSTSAGEIVKNGLATKLRATIAQKQVENEVGLANGDLLRLMMGVLKDNVIDIDSLVFAEKLPGETLFPLQAVEFSRLIGALKPEESEDVIVSACQKLRAFFHQRPEQKSIFVTQHGFLPLMELLEAPRTRVISSVLQVINQIIMDNTGFQENACLVGLIPIVMSFAVPDRPREIRMEAACFLQQLCQSSPLTLQMFIACRGIPVLVGFLEADYAKYRDMVHLAIDGMWQVIKLQRSTPRNDFCRIAAKNGILLRLINTLYSLNEATRLVPVSGGGGSPCDGFAPRPQSGPLDSITHIPGQGGSLISGSDQSDVARMLRIVAKGTQDPSGTSTSYSRRSDANEKPRLSSYTLDEATSSDWVSTTINDGSRAEGDVKQLRLSNAASRSSTDRPPKLIDSASSGPATAEVAHQEKVRPLLSLLEKEPPSGHFSGQLEYARHLTGSDRHESILPLHATNEKKTTAEPDFLMAEFAEVSRRGKENGTPDATPRALQKTLNKKTGLLASSEGHPSTSGIASQTASSVLSGSGVLNARPGSAMSSGVLSHMVASMSADVAKEYLEKVADLLLEFAQADATVKSYMCSQSLLSRLFQMFNRIEPPILLKILKCVNHLSTDPNCLENLQRADAIKYLIPNLELKDGILVSQIHHEVLNALFNLCKINKRRQEQAAENGIIPHLMQFIMSGSPLKQYALPLLCDMAHASRNSREQLRAHDGLDVYLSLLDDESWSVTALDSIAICLAHDNDNHKVEQALLKKEAVQKLVKFFQCCPEQHFVHILEPFLKIITKSPRLNTTLAVNGLTPLLIARLDHQDAIARLNLLKLIKAVYEHHPRPKQLIVENNLPQKLQNLIEERRDGLRSGGQVLVKQMATSLLKALHINTVL
ncbi:unnamed protein product [Rhodiola kirilowii]